jgi:hypothetical protein
VSCKRRYELVAALHVSHNALSGVRSFSWVNYSRIFSTRATAIWQPICEMDTIGLSAHDSTPIRQSMCERMWAQYHLFVGSRGLGSPAIDVRDHYNLNWKNASPTPSVFASVRGQSRGYGPSVHFNQFQSDSFSEPVFESRITDFGHFRLVSQEVHGIISQSLQTSDLSSFIQMNLWQTCVSSLIRTHDLFMSSYITQAT